MHRISKIINPLESLIRNERLFMLTLSIRTQEFWKVKKEGKNLRIIPQLSSIFMSSASSNLASNTSSAAGFDESYEGDDDDDESELLQSASGFTLSLCICFLLDRLLSFFELGLFF